MRAALLVLALLGPDASAQPSGQRGPPPPAFDACRDAAAGDPCSFQTPRGSESGTCYDFQEGLACLPEGMPAPPGADTRRRPARASETQRRSTRTQPAQKRRNGARASTAGRAAAVRAQAAPAAALPASAPAPAAAPAVAPAPAAAPAAPAAAPPPAKPAAGSVPAGAIGALLGVLATALAFALWKLRSLSAATAPVTAGTATVTAPPAAQTVPAAGQPTLVVPDGGLVAGHFELRREVGRGGMGVVYEAFDRSLDRRVALKKLRPEVQSTQRDRERFLAEAKLVAKLQHPHIVGIYSIEEDRGDLYLVFEFVEGESLDGTLDRVPRLPPAEAVRVLARVAEGIDYAHGQKVIHRDLKPSNIMVDTTGRPRVMDFGIAHQAKVTVSRVTTAEAYGTLAYMPPEQALGRAVRESDVYAFGAVAYEALVGERAFTGPDLAAQKAAQAFQRPSQAGLGLSAHVDKVFETVLDPEPKKRFPTTGEFVGYLKQALGV